MVFFSTGIGGNVDNTGSHVSVFRREGTGLNGDFLNGVIGDVGGRDTGKGILLGEAIDVVGDLGRTTATEVNFRRHCP